jgi:hypothetical protein
MATPMTSAQFRAIVEPVLNEAFNGIYEQRDDEYKQIFSEVQGIARAYHEDVMMYTFGAAPEMPAGQAVSYAQGGVLWKKQFDYAVFGLAFALTQVLVEDGDHIRLGTTFSKGLAQAMGETKETRCANHLNRAFNSSYTGGDGKELCATDHPIIGGTFSNELSTAAALSQTSLEQMIIDIGGAVDNNGKKIRLTPDKLVVPTALQFQAEVLLNSTLRAGTANNDINPIKSTGLLKGGIAKISRLTSNSAWWITTKEPRQADRGLKVLMRRKLTKSMEGDFETDSARYKVTERYGDGWFDPRCIYGTAGV